MRRCQTETSQTMVWILHTPYSRHCPQIVSGHLIVRKAKVKKLRMALQMPVSRYAFSSRRNNLLILQIRTETVVAHTSEREPHLLENNQPSRKDEFHRGNSGVVSDRSWGRTFYFWYHNIKMWLWPIQHRIILLPPWRWKWFTPLFSYHQRPTSTTLVFICTRTPVILLASNPLSRLRTIHLVWVILIFLLIIIHKSVGLVKMFSCM